VLRPSPPSPEFAQAFEQSTVSAHYARRGANIWSTAQMFPDTVVLNGNGLEVARCFYYPSGTHPPVTDAGRLLDLVRGWRSVGAIADRTRDWLAEAAEVCARTGLDVLARARPSRPGWRRRGRPRSMSTTNGCRTG
jgi:hypothetical protein